MQARVRSVKNVNLDIPTGAPNRLVIVAVAEARGTGWTQPTLIPHDIVWDDGITLYDFVANPPQTPIDDSQTQMLVASAILEQPPLAKVKGVRVLGATESVTTRLITRSDAPFPDGHPVYVEDASVLDDQLIVDVSYGSGGGTHSFALFWDGSYIETFPQRVKMRLSHNANDDFGRAIVREQLYFDLLDLDHPTFIELSTAEGFSKTVSYRVRDTESLRPTRIVAFGPGGIPIINEAMSALFTRLLTDPAKFAAFLADPKPTLSDSTLAPKLEILRDPITQNGIGVVLKGLDVSDNVINGLGIILRTLGVPDQTLSGSRVVINNGSTGILSDGTTGNGTVGVLFLPGG